MSLIAFKHRNHPQQVAVQGAADSVDERHTPAWLFDPLTERHGFTLDAAASAGNAKCAKFYTRGDSGLEHSWAGEVVWCNPPFSDLPSWVAKAVKETASGCKRVVMLLPANRTEQRWWQEHIEGRRDRGLGITVQFLPRRIQFGAPGNPNAKWRSSPPFGCCLIVFDPWRPSL